MENFELRERILDLMDRNLEIREKICKPFKENPFDKFFKWIKGIFFNLLFITGWCTFALNFKN